MDAVPTLDTLIKLPNGVWNVILHVVVITVVPVLLLLVFLAVRVSTMVAIYLAGSWALKRVPRYKDPLGAWKMTWNKVEWTEFCEKMRRKDGSFFPVLNCGPSVDGRHWVAISNPELVKKVLTTPEPDEEVHNLYARLRITSPTFADAYSAWVGEGLLASHGSKWHIHRKASVPLFFSSILFDQLSFISQSTHDLIRSLRITPPLLRSFLSPQKHIFSHVMRSLLHLLAGPDIVHEAKISTNKHSIDWMIIQQQKLLNHFRSSLQTTSFLGGRVWHILGNRVSSLLPWVGGEGNLHDLQRERRSLATYFQSLINRLRYDENDDSSPHPPCSHDFLSLLFNLKLDEDFDIQHNLPQTRFPVSVPSSLAPSSLPTPHTPTPPLPSRRNILKRSMSNIGRKPSTSALVLTPPASPSLTGLSSSPSTPATPVVPPSLQHHPQPTTEDSTDESPEFERLPPILTTDMLSTSRLRNFKITSAADISLNSSTVSDEGTESDPSHDSPPEQFSPLPQFATQNNEQDDDEGDSYSSHSTYSGWETSSDGSANEAEAPLTDPAMTDKNWSTMPYNSKNEADTGVDEDPECIPGSQPPRPGHLPDETIIDQALSFLAAGFQPISSTLEWCLYHIAKDKDIYLKLQHESHLVLDGHLPNIAPTDVNQEIPSDERAYHGSGLGLGDVSVTPEKLNQLKYTRNFVKEVLRFHPTQPVLERITTGNVKWGDKNFPEGTAIGLMIWNLHRDPHFWNEPDKFWPERFDTSDGKMENGPKHAFAYLPFSFGSHSCIGQKYAMQQIIVTISLLVRAFEMELNRDEGVKEKFFDGLLSPSPLLIRFTPRDYAVKVRYSASVNQ